MITDRALLERWEREWMRREAPDYLRNLRWLREFEQALGESLQKRFEGILEESR